MPVQGATSGVAPTLLDVIVALSKLRHAERLSPMARRLLDHSWLELSPTRDDQRPVVVTVRPAARACFTKRVLEDPQVHCVCACVRAPWPSPCVSCRGRALHS